MSDSPENPDNRSWAILAIIGVLLLALVLFGPLLGALIEGALFRTRHVEDFIQAIGLYELYTNFYHAIHVIP